MPRAATTTTKPTLPAIDPNAPVITDDDLVPAAEIDDELGFTGLDEIDDTINALFYGPPGSGKTTAVAAMANLPEPGRVLIINSEGGLKKIALAKRGIDTSRIVTWPKPGVRITRANLEALHQRILSDLQADPHSWVGVVFDSLTEIATVFRENATSKRQDQYDSIGRSYDPDFIDVADYGVQTDHIKRILRRFRDLPCHFAMTALERTDDKTGMTGPDLNPAVASAAMGYPDLVLYCRSTQPDAEASVGDDAPAEFRAATREGKRFHAKDRLDVLPRALAVPTFDRIAAYMRGELDEESDALQADYLTRKAEREELLAAAKAERDARKRSATTKKA